MSFQSMNWFPLVGIILGIGTILIIRALFNHRSDVSLQSWKRELIGFIIACLVWYPLFLLFTLLLLGLPTLSNDIFNLIILTIMMIAGIPAGWFWTRIMN